MKVSLYPGSFYLWKKLSYPGLGSLEAASEISLCVQSCWGCDGGVLRDNTHN